MRGGGERRSAATASVVAAWRTAKAVHRTSAQVQGAATRLAFVVPPERLDSVRNTVPTRLAERFVELIVVVTRGVPVVVPVLNRRTCELPVA
jgi:hypothetical protein